MNNPGSRQIYLTFPADSTFKEEDVSTYFSNFGPVQDVRIPYQQKRMFEFVTFDFSETVKPILAKGNPHFLCDARVLVKPYKEKGKIPDKHRKQQQDLASSPTGTDPHALLAAVATAGAAPSVISAVVSENHSCADGDEREREKEKEVRESLNYIYKK
ncbi:zinc finger CCCH domain-containing protein 23-like [Salvia miltiorrhiza]|uniref:zinc finger CCCH domain-containing protein 23-like n=1 Tax=Salvia miltiorrhiza TaxID=226208 RepID=UPI0025AC95BB|nr:zinc finger CCCH domain-containing protein 23-like [Salvia miltiorrhiza]